MDPKYFLKCGVAASALRIHEAVCLTGNRLLARSPTVSQAKTESHFVSFTTFDSQQKLICDTFTWRSDVELFDVSVISCAPVVSRILIQMYLRKCAKCTCQVLLPVLGAERNWKATGQKDKKFKLISRRSWRSCLMTTDTQHRQSSSLVFHTQLLSGHLPASHTWPRHIKAVDVTAMTSANAGFPYPPVLLSPLHTHPTYIPPGYPQDTERSMSGGARRVWRVAGGSL
ncbi:hypothetical protein C0Q70_14978 [Pomacea canaliculata]|uniref:Uncharacterized protein n=1 Tax=Pomacea canaliculata TaxID=400727 RepID=A0A2T7NTK1_POMCA|nr:hypothetical protein C0Q70_14978 [Pomacea canaliculata]